MTWQTETVESSDTYREFLASMVAVMTSQHVSAVVLNAAGTGYTVGDVLTITHASAYHDCRLEVLTITGGGGTGPIGTVKLLTGGAFAERVVSAVVGAAAGSGYVVGDLLAVGVGVGAATENALFRVATLSGSAVATVTLKWTGGAYTTTPTTNEAATLGVSTGFAGDDVATLDLTMQTIVGSTAIAVAGGTGSSGSFDLTLTATGWTTLYDKHNHDWGVQPDDNDRDVVLEGTVSGGDTPIIGFASVMGDDGGAIDRYSIACFGMSAFNPALALALQPNIGPLAWTVAGTSGSHILVTEEVAEGNSWWISATGRRVSGCIRGNVSGETNSYHTFYVGHMNQYGTATTSPYPLLVAGSAYNWNQDTFDSAHTGLAECYQEVSANGPVYFLRKTDLNWQSVENGTVSTVQQDKVMWPLGAPSEPTAGPNQIVTDENHRRLNSDGVISSSVRAATADQHYPAPGTNDEFVLMPLTVIDRGESGGADDIHTHIAGELDGCFWAGGTKADGTIFTSEDYIENAAGDRYRVFPCSNEGLASRRYQFMLMRED